MLNMLKNKKGQGLSLNVIIIAAIALIVLVVLWAIFTGRMGIIAEGLAEADQKCDGLCSAIGSTKVSFTTTACAENTQELRQIKVKQTDGSSATQYCCCNQ